MFTFVVAEIMQLVQYEWTADGPAVLLVLVRQLLVQDRIVRGPSAVAEVADEGAVQLVRARFGDGIDLHTRGTALCRVEPVRDELELRDCVVAVARLVAGAEVRRHLQTIDIQLELTDVNAVLHW